MGEVVEFTGSTTLPVDPQKVLAAAYGAELVRVTIVGVVVRRRCPTALGHGTRETQPPGIGADLMPKRKGCKPK